MQTDLIGKVNNVNLPPRHGLVLLFEAIVNSADAIAESGREDGQITISIVVNFDLQNIVDKQWVIKF